MGDARTVTPEVSLLWLGERPDNTRQLVAALMNGKRLQNQAVAGPDESIIEGG
jgi:hypothetical protein